LFAYASEDDAIMKLGRAIEFSRTIWVLPQIIEVISIIENKTHGFQDRQVLLEETTQLCSRKLGLTDDCLPTLMNGHQIKQLDHNYHWVKALRKASQGANDESILLVNGRVSPKGNFMSLLIHSISTIDAQRKTA
jgi:hypothetical protein